MKTSYLLLAIFLLFTGCSSDDDYAIINGRVERAVNGEGIANQSVIVMTRKVFGSSSYGYTEALDRKVVVTDANGNFSTALITDVGAFTTVSYLGDDDYYGSGLLYDYRINELAVIKVDKFIKFKIFVKNTDPFDENDFIHIDFFGGLNVLRTGIENFGIGNIHHPANPVYGTGAWEETSWKGIDVNSIVYYSVPESAEDFKIIWHMIKNGMETNGFTNDIPYNTEEVNSYSFEY